MVVLTKRNGGTAKPEYRLPTMFIGAWIVPIGLFFLVWLDSRQEGALDRPDHWHRVRRCRHVRRVCESSVNMVGESLAHL